RRPPFTSPTPSATAWRSPGWRADCRWERTSSTPTRGRSARRWRGGRPCRELPPWVASLRNQAKGRGKRMRGKGILILALLAMLTLAVSATMGPAAGASKGGATVAKKKCKKKKKTSSASAAKKKKKCKKKGTGGGGGTTPNPVVRATL